MHRGELIFRLGGVFASVTMMCLLAAGCTRGPEGNAPKKAPTLNATLTGTAPAVDVVHQEEPADNSDDPLTLGALPPIQIRLKAENRGGLASIAVGRRDLGADPAKLVGKIREIFGDLRPIGADVHFDWICDSRLRYEEVHRVVTELDRSLGPWQPDAVFWFWNDEMPYPDPERGRETTAGFRLTRAKPRTGSVNGKDVESTDVIQVRVQSKEQGVEVVVTLSGKTLPEGDLQDAAAKIARRVAEAKHRKVVLAVQADQDVDYRNWPQLVGEMAKRRILGAIDRVELSCGRSQSLRCLKLYQPRIGAEVPEDHPEH